MDNGATFLDVETTQQEAEAKAWSSSWVTSGINRP